MMMMMMILLMMHIIYNVIVSGNKWLNRRERRKKIYENVQHLKRVHSAHTRMNLSVLKTV